MFIGSCRAIRIVRLEDLSATLLQFGLTRPFPGAAEADHIQLA